MDPPKGSIIYTRRVFSKSRIGGSSFGAFRGSGLGWSTKFMKQGAQNNAKCGS